MIMLDAERIGDLGACWTESDCLAYLDGREAVSIREVLLDQTIELDDRCWLASRLLVAELGTGGFVEWLLEIIEHGIRAAQGCTGDPAWEAWAARWLSGADRSLDAARVAGGDDDLTFETTWAAQQTANLIRGERGAGRNACLGASVCTALRLAADALAGAGGGEIEAEYHLEAALRRLEGDHAA